MKRIIMASITVVVVIAVMAGALIPVLDDATATTDTFKNDGLYFMNSYDTTLNTTVSWDHTDPNKITVGTDVIDLTANTGSIPYTLIASSDFVFRYSAGSTWGSIQVWAESWGSSLYQAGTGAGTDMDITISGGTITLDNGSGTTKTYTYTDPIYMISVSGDYVMKKSTESAYLNADTEVIGAGRTSVGANINFWITGTIDDGFTIGNTFGDSTANITFSDLESTQTAVNDYLDLYAFEKITFTATDTQTTTEYPVVYSQVIVPYEVTAERANHFTDGENAIFNAIPVMIIIALLLGVVALVLRSRMD